MAANPIEVLRANRREIVRSAEDVGRKRLRSMLVQAQTLLNERLKHAEGLSGPGAESFTAAQLRATMAQIELVLRQMTKPLTTITKDGAVAAVDPAVEGVIAYLKAAEERFSGISERLPLRDAILFERAKSGVDSSVLNRLQGDPKKGPGILHRYGDAVIERFENHLQQRLLARTPWNDVRNGLIADSPFLQQAPAFWAERIVRTEAMNASNRAIWESNKAADEQLGDVVKILSATFDDRTGADSVAVHGQIRRPNEPFDWWDGPYQHPPNRPNDREVVVTHRLSWPIPDELKWKSDAQVTSTWIANGRKGSPPARPKMTTVELDEFGKAPKPKKQPIVEPPEIPEKPQREAVASPFFDENVTPFVSPVEKKPEPIPEPIPEIQAPKAPIDFLAQREGAQAGSNPGGFYRGSDNVLRYVKFYADPVQAELEKLANRIYADLGLPAVKSDTFEHEGKKAHAAEVVEGTTLKKKGLKPADARRVLKGFAADVLVGNWDAVGLEHDNVLIAGNKAIRIDQGGALLHRAKAGLKPDAVLNRIDEWEKFFDPHTNPAYAKVAQAAGVSKAEDIDGLKGQLQAIQKLKKAHGSWGNYVDHVSPDLPPDARKKVVMMLSERSRLLDDKLKQIKAAAKLPKIQGQARVFEKLEIAHLPKQKLKPEGIDSHAVYQSEVRRKMDAILQADEKKTGKREARSALDDFTAGGYRAIRQAVRLGREGWAKEHGSSDYEMRRFDSLIKQHDALDRMFENHGPTMPEMGVDEIFRGIGNLSKEVFERLVAAHQFEVEAAVSTSWQPEVSKNFMGGGQFSVFFKMKPQKGSTNWLAIETHSSHRSEMEILLRKGTRFKVTGVKRNSSGSRNVAIIELEEIHSSTPEAARKATI